MASDHPNDKAMMEEEQFSFQQDDLAGVDARESVLEQVRDSLTEVQTFEDKLLQMLSGPTSPYG